LFTSSLGASRGFLILQLFVLTATVYILLRFWKSGQIQDKRPFQNIIDPESNVMPNRFSGEEPALYCPSGNTWKTAGSSSFRVAPLLGMTSSFE